jgi:hypothetical protein
MLPPSRGTLFVVFSALDKEVRFGFPSRVALLTGLLVIAVTGCAKGKNLGPGLPVCTRPPGTTTCTATWTGANTGSTSCTQTSWGNTTSWNLMLDGSTPNQLSAGATLSSTPAAGQSFTMEQLQGYPMIQLDASSDWWGATPNIGGQMLLHVDQTAPG